MSVKIPTISIPPTESIDDLRLSIQSALNRTIELANRDTITGPMSMQGNRITDMRKGVSANDAVTLKQLNDNIGVLKRRGSLAGSTTGHAGARYIKLTFELLETISVANNVTPHLELPIRDGEYAVPIEAYINLKGVGATDLTIDLKYSIDYCTATPATRTWTSVFGASNELTLLAGKDQLCSPKTLFNNPGPFIRGTKFRCDVLAASGTVAVIVLVLEVT